MDDKKLDLDISGLRDGKFNGNIRDTKEIIRGLRIIETANHEARKGGAWSLIDCRLYMGRSSNASTIYCLLWISGNKSGQGMGSAGGCGYDKQSAAVADALQEAGVMGKDAHFGGVGWEQAAKVLMEVAKLNGAVSPLAVEFYA